VSGNPDGDRNFEETNSKLTKGLKSCRKLLNNYRALLSSRPNGEWSHTAPGFDIHTGPAAGPDPIES
jgi:hypothetical protein